MDGIYKGNNHLMGKTTLELDKELREVYQRELKASFYNHSHAWWQVADHVRKLLDEKGGKK